jgi:hypothetical protein
MNAQTYDQMNVTGRNLKNTLKKSCALMVDGKLYGPTNYQISVWEYEGGGYQDSQEDPLAHRKGLVKKPTTTLRKLFQVFSGRGN